MRTILPAAAAIGLAVQIFSLSTALPANAITAQLAKKCRDLAIKAHPPAVAGTTPYAAAERDFFRSCVANNGQVDNSPQPDKPADDQH